MRIFNSIVLTFAFIFALPVLGVTQTSLVKQTKDAGFIAATDAERAIADVQIRRIKHMISTKTIDPDVAFDRWEKLQNKYKGR